MAAREKPIRALRPAPAARLYVIVASEARRAIVFQKTRGWWSLFDWDLARDALVPGASFSGTLYPRRADLSPDGALLYFFALKRGQAHHGISKTPWLFALAFWSDSGTWTRGHHFIRDARGHCALGQPHKGTVAPLARKSLGLATTGVIQYATERRLGWVEHERCPPRAQSDVWDEQRTVVLTRPRPIGRERLVLTDRGWRASGGTIEGRSPTYSVENCGEPIELPEASWADWDHDGRLLIATSMGELQIRDGARPEKVLATHAMCARAPRGPAPEWARTW